ncbi:hypothetical protein ACFLQL_00725 [Verrucomicrobiota bacterium]
MRKTCLNCTRKHLANAEALLDEAAMGYPSFFWLAIGQMDQASSELIKTYPDMANIIRDRRVLMIENRFIRKTDNTIKLYDPDILELIELIDVIEDQELEIQKTS